MLATLIAFDGSQATLSLPGAQPITAASLVPLQAADIGRTAAITLHGDSQALVLGLIWKAEPATTTLHDVIVDGQHVSIEAKESITLACGRASVTLTADGQILLRGDYISNHSTGTQRIKGAAVQIN
ncbi:hypothetical protein QWZ03_13215 [Chitinimonas viridis]|nr:MULTISPECIES: hypothetical protein [Chitinimonas]MDN3577732.1 hypothetical protein [Chitinimonas viridis]